MARENKDQVVLKSVKRPEQFYEMLAHIINRLKYPGTEPFQIPVDPQLLPDYAKIVVNPVNLKSMENKVLQKNYVSLEAFHQDMKWLLHNCIVYNGVQSKLTTIAKSMLRTLKHELNEITVCCDCYLNSIRKENEKSWFAQLCRTPHLLVFAKIRGYPYWPAKALRVVGNEMDVRFFGAHDRAMVALNKCYWLSKEPPVSPKTHQSNIQMSNVELKMHIDLLKKKYGVFRYAEPMVLVNLNVPHVFFDKLKDGEFEFKIICVVF